MVQKFIIPLLSIAFCIAFVPLKAQGNAYPPYTRIKDKIVISQFHTLDKPETTEGIFLNALLWTIENRNAGEWKEEIPTIETDYDKKQFAVETILTNPKTASQYHCTFSVKVSDNIITVLVSDITYEAETTVIKLVKRLPFEKLQPEKKPKHKEYLDEFAALYQAYSKQMIEAITSNHPPIIGHWTEIKEGTVVKGMTEDECMLAMGKPASIQKQGNKTEWMYDAYTYLFFENGTLTSFIK